MLEHPRHTPALSTQRHPVQRDPNQGATPVSAPDVAHDIEHHAEPSRSSFIGNSFRVPKLWRTARWRSGEQMTRRKPPPPAPVTLTPVAPASSACSTARSIRSFDTPDASCRFVSQPCRIAPPSASTSPLRKSVARRGRQVSQGVQLRKGGGDIRRLFMEDRVGAPGDTGVEEHDLPL